MNSKTNFYSKSIDAIDETTTTDGFSSADSCVSLKNEDKKFIETDSIMDSDQFVENTMNISLDTLNLYQQNKVSTITIRGVPVISLLIDGKERLCLAQISNTMLKNYSYNEIHNRRVALGINCIQCTPVQLEILRRTGAMPISSRRCGMITRREAERLVKSFLEECKPPSLPENFTFPVYHKCGWGSRGIFFPSRYNSSRAKCIRCYYCNLFYSPNKFIFHAHNLPDSRYIQPDTANFNSWRRHLLLVNPKNDENLANAWEDVKAIFNGGTRKRLNNISSISGHSSSPSSRSNSPVIRDNKNKSSKFKVDSFEIDSSCEIINSNTSKDIEPIPNRGNLLSNSKKRRLYSPKQCEAQCNNSENSHIDHMNDMNTGQPRILPYQQIIESRMNNENSEYSLTLSQIMAIISSASSNYPYFPLSDATRATYYPNFLHNSNIFPYMNQLNIAENQIKTQNFDTGESYPRNPFISSGNSFISLQKQQQEQSNSIRSLFMNENEEQITSKRTKLSNKPFVSDQNNFYQHQ